jgi:hypothetical protein
MCHLLPSMFLKLRCHADSIPSAFTILLSELAKPELRAPLRFRGTGQAYESLVRSPHLFDRCFTVNLMVVRMSGSALIFLDTPSEVPTNLNFA